MRDQCVSEGVRVYPSAAAARAAQAPGAKPSVPITRPVLSGKAAAAAAEANAAKREGRGGLGTVGVHSKGKGSAKGGFGAGAKRGVGAGMTFAPV